MNRVAMVVFSHYPIDVRVRREAETLIEAGMSVDIVCLRKETQPPKETINDVTVYRINLRRKRTTQIRYLYEYTYFVLRAFLKLSILYLRNRYHIVHVHTMPDILVFSTILCRLGGAKIMLDMHDPMPEVFMAKYTMGVTHPIIRMLRLIEKYSIRFSDQVITPNVAFRKLFISRGCPPEKIDIIMNTPKEKIFHKNIKEFNKDDSLQNDKFVIMFHGTVVERHGLNTALEALIKVRKVVPGLVFKVYGRGDFVEKFLARVNDLNLTDIVEYYGFVSNESIAEAILDINVGIIPNELNPFTQLNLPVRIFEYLSLGKPVIVPRTSGIQDYFDEGSINFFESGNIESLAGTIISIYREPERQKQILDRGMRVYRQHCWEVQGRHFVDITRNLLEGGSNILLREKRHESGIKLTR